MSKVSPWTPLRNRAYLMLWTAQMGTNLGVWMQTVGAQWFLVAVGASAVFVTLVQTALTAPYVLLSLPAGVLADSHDRRRVLIAANGFAAIICLILTGVALTGWLEPIGLLALTFFIGCGAAINAPAWQAVQPSLVPREQIPAAAGLASITINGARAIGPAVAGFLVALGGPTIVFALNAVVYCAATGITLSWHSPEEKQTTPERIRPALLAGMRYVKAAPHVSRILLRTALFTIPASALWALLPVEASGRLRLGSGGYGMLLAFLGMGALSGIVLLPWLRRFFSYNHIIVFMSLGYGVATVAIAMLPPWGAAVGALLAGASWMCTFTTLNSLLQLTLAPWVRARGMATYLFTVMCAQALGAPAWGVVATMTSATKALIAAGLALLVLVPLSVWAWPLYPKTGQLDISHDPFSHDLSMAHEIDPEVGPVQVQVRYRVRSVEAERFVQAMRPVRLSRLRTGATSWSLTHRLEDSGLFFERFALPTWGEYMRQQNQRMTGFDRANIRAALRYVNDEPRVRRELPAAIVIDEEDESGLSAQQAAAFPIVEEADIPMDEKPESGS